MTQIIHNTSFPNDGLGDPLRTAFVHQNEMNTELYETKVDKVTGKGLSSNDYTNLEKAKLAGIENGAQVNVPILYDDIIGIPELNSIAAYPDTKFDYVDSNDFTIPENVQALSVRKNGEPTDNKLDWVQLGNVISYIGTLTVPDYLIISGVYVIPSGSGGGGSGELISKFTSNPIPTIVGTNILIPANETWLIDSVPYTNPTASTIPFSYAPDGLLYFLTVVATKFNTFIGKFGTASTDPSEPVVNNDELFLTTYLISDGTATVIIPPVNSNIYVEKEIYQPQITIGSAPVGAIAMGKKSALVIAGTVPSIEFIIKNNPNDYFIGQPFQTTNKTPNNVKFTHLSSDVAGNPNSISWYNPELTDYYAVPNEVTLWILDIIDGQKVYRRATTYIDTDNVLFRSGTKVGKPIIGDLEFAKSTNLKTIEEAGVRSVILADKGLWSIQIFDGVDNPIFEFSPDKGLIADKFFDKESDNLAYAQMGDVLPLADRIFDLELVVDNKADLVGGLVPSSQLPAYVDDVLEFANLASFPVTGEVGKIYVALDSNKQYRWSGSSYIQITNGLIASTNDVPEGSNLYFTTARVLAALLSGISFATGGAIVSTDSVLVAFGKIQKQINDFGTALGLKQDTLTDTNFATFTNSVSDKSTQANTDVLAYVDITTGKWVKQTFSNLVDYLKGFFQTKKEIITNATVSGTYNLDASLTDTYNLTLTGNTTLALINTSSTFAEPMTVYITGNFSLAYPAGSTIIGIYRGNMKNQLVIEKIGSVIYITVNNYV